MSSSNTKQTRLDFSVSKRTASNSGKLAKTAPRPVETLPKKVPPAKGDVIEEDEQERSFEEITVISSDSDDDSELIEPFTDDTDSRVSKPTAKEVSSSNTGRTTRAASKAGAQASKAEAKAQENASATIENPGVFRHSNSRPEPTPPKVKSQEAVTPNAEPKDSLPELKVRDPRWKKYYAEIKKKTGDMPPSKTCFIQRSTIRLLKASPPMIVHGEGQNKIHEILRIFDTCAYFYYMHIFMH